MDTRPSEPLVIPANWTFRDGGIAAAFDRHVREQLPWYDLATGAVAHVARHFLPEAGVAYDLGAATGNIGRAISETLVQRHATLLSVEVSEEMAQHYQGPQPESLIVGDIRSIPYTQYDLAVAFLTLMFVPVPDRRDLMSRLRSYCRKGGAIVIFDKTEAVGGYAGTVLWRLALAGKVATGVDAEEIVAKELSLGGVQRPVDPIELFPDAVEFFRFGEFAGWLIAR